APSRCTVHAPHSAMQQPNLVPVRLSVSRSTHSSGVSASTSTRASLPLMLSSIIAILHLPTIRPGVVRAHPRRRAAMCVLVAGMRGADRPSTMPLSDEPRRAPLSATTPSTNPAVISAEVVIIGAGPCGLFQVFELGLLGISAHVVDSLQHPGGQCAELYPDKPIYDIPPLPICGAQELVDRLLQQIKPFKAQLHLGHEVTEFARAADGRFHIGTAGGVRFDAGAVVVAAGLGSFQPRRIGVEGAEPFEGGAILYRIRNAAELAGKRLVVFGGGDSALDWTLELAARAASLDLVPRPAGVPAGPAPGARL